MQVVLEQEEIFTVTNLCKFPVVVQSSQCVQLLESNDKGLSRRGVHKIKVNQIVDTQALQE